MKKKIIYGVSGGYGDILLHTPMMREAMRRNPDADFLFPTTHPEIIARSFPTINVNKFRFQHQLEEDSRFHGDMVLHTYNSHFYNQRLMGEGMSRHAIDLIARLYLGDDKLESRDMTIDLPTMNDHLFAMLEMAKKKAAGRPTVGVTTMTAIRKVKEFHFNKTIFHKDMPPHVCAELAAKMPDVLFVQLGLTVEFPMIGAMDYRGLSLLESVFLMQQLDTYLVPEGVYAHAMAALQRKGCVLWTGVDPEVYGHPQHQVAVEVQGLECKPCNRPFGALGDMDERVLMPWTCPDPKCQSLITTDMVVAGARQALEENRR